MLYTTNYNLIKPQRGDNADFCDVNDLNDNADIIDAEMKSLADGKVDKVTGKGLSTEDYTTEEKTKLAGIEAGATNYVHPATHPFTMITGAPTSYPANGGNADTVDGKHASDFAAAGSAKKYVTLVVGTTASGHTAADVDYLCDGTADDVEINAAIQALPASGRKILIREGTYDITSTVSISKANITVEGMGNSTILKSSMGTGSLTTIPANHIIIVKISAENVIMRNLQIDGEAYSETAYPRNANQDCIIISNTENDTGNNTRLGNLFLINNVTSIHVEGDNAIILNSIIDRCYHEAIKVIGNKSIISDNHIGAKAGSYSNESLSMTGNNNIVMGNVYGRTISDTGTGNLVVNNLNVVNN